MGEIGRLIAALGQALLFADVNNSGYPDLFIPRGAWLSDKGRHPNSLLRNNGDNTFTDITLVSGLYEKAPRQTAAFADVTGNGFLDLFVGNESSRWLSSDMGGSTAVGLPGARFPSSFFLNNGDETFTRVEIESLQVDAFVKGVAWGDINNDGWPDLYVSVMGDPNLLFVHRGLDERGLPQFEEIAESAGVGLPLWSFPFWFWDYNNNGLEDILVLTYDARHAGSVGFSIQFGAEPGEPLGDGGTYRVEVDQHHSLPLVSQRRRQVDGDLGQTIGADHHHEPSLTAF